MSLINKTKQAGFTIVELLIVIVVIGILAAITIVAYNGVQTRAKLATYQSDTVGLVKKTEAFNSVTGAYPQTVAGIDAAPATCPSATANGGAALVTALSGQPESKLSTGISFCGVLTAAAGTALTYANALTAATVSTTVNYYYASWCATGKGMYIYYPDPTTSTVKSVTAGVCP